MKPYLKVLAGMVMGLSLAACGGDDGDSSSPETPVTPPSSSLTLSVAINDTAATVNDGSEFAVNSGDMVQLTPDQATCGWSSHSSVSGAITLNVAGMNNTLWAARVVNNTSSIVSYTITATTCGDDSTTQDVVLTVSPASEPQ
jgi:hypothetical protein